MDLLFAILLVASAAIGMFAAGLRTSKLRGKHAASGIAIAAVAVLVLYAAWGRDSVLLARILPFSSLLVLGNLFPPLVGLIAGIMWTKKATPRWRRIGYVAGLAGVAGYSIAQPFLGSSPLCQNLWKEGVCMQTTAATCSPACAATVLAGHGIDATEEEMARLCLTRQGTLWQGLYRGLKLKTSGTGHGVQVFSGSVDELRRFDGPSILVVGIPRGMAVDPIYTERFSWTPGTMHSVVLFGFAENDRVNMGDPSVGREQWTLDDLRVLYRGKGLRLISNP